ncbi:hypothetical protein F5144DRAFT_615865 [Chaetomium tenue]|uniref:Uncharacterized protein n=1 Tax=Chaetomium tenue TaxID=1854479 RepID=A0ACB7NXN2_9PEZI|nr:hypothetical protein F5144DRAFT_615865 [Chaetomium globosum]
MRSQPPFLSLAILLLFSPSPHQALALENLPAGVDITEDTPGQVTINGDPTGNTTLGPDIPITATIFSGVPGPSTCRGHILLQLTLPQPAPAPADGARPPPPQPETCYTLPPSQSHSQGTTAGCGIFLASKAAGCEARLFSEPGCRAYVNTAVFVPEERAVGGRWRSVGVRCGVVPPDLGGLRPPLVEPLAYHGIVRAHPRDMCMFVHQSRRIPGIRA